MKWLICPLLLVLALHAATEAPGARRPPEAVDISGKELLPLTHWASANGLEIRWLKRDETLQLSSRSTKIVLTVDSREAQLNGTEIWLLFPVVQRNGTVYLSQLDLQTTLEPIIAPPKNRPGAAIKSVCLDPGHGGKDPGNHLGSNQEKKFTLLLALELREQLTRAGIKATLTRATDTFIELPTRPELAKRRNADVFISLHFNAFAQNSVRGAEVYCLTPAGASSTNARGEGGGAGWFAGNHCNEKNMFLAYQMQKSLTKNLAVDDRGLKRARYAVLRDAVMPAVLIEGGFMSNPAEGRKIFDAAYRKQMARAIVEGLLAYKRTVEEAG
jgi:N-acetylmuramoyl-L-alanine amidase